MPTPSPIALEIPEAGRVRHRLTVRGTVQGVGFRPFVYRSASALALGGWVVNSPDGVVLEAEGSEAAVRALLERIRENAPTAAVVDSIEIDVVPVLRERSFAIRHSRAEGRVATMVLPDLATCEDCVAEISDPADRRHLYPFTTCTHCGPRFSVIECLPYERARTSMKHFRLCEACAAEYEDPADRRFHAEATACPVCGPQLALWQPDGRTISTRHQALQETADALRRGLIVAVKGLGGFHLCVDARDEEAVHRLRARKGRPAKAFATLFARLADVEACCELDGQETALLRGPQAPIVLLKRRGKDAHGIADAVAPGNPRLGVMLAYTPLHHLLLSELGFPLVATSANVSDEPIVFDERDLGRLAGVADLFLVHDRPILRPVDDSVLHVVADRPMLLRRSRGYAAAPAARTSAAGPVLALGGHMKSTLALTVGDDVVLSQHLGTLSSQRSRAVHARTMEDLSRLYAAAPRRIACDMHPDYYTSRQAARSGLPVVRVQHHVAHVRACMAEHGLDAPLLGVAWDGTGYGPDESIWGGEFVLVSQDGYRRVAHLRAFPLPGGDRAVREPRRSALGVLYALYGAGALERNDLAPLAAFTARERGLLGRALARGVNVPPTSSAGRLFDAAAALAGLCQRASYEGQAAAMLEWALGDQPDGARYDFAVQDAGPRAAVRWIVDWAPAIERLIDDTLRGESLAVISAALHNGLVQAIVDVAARVGEARLVLTGGCFQNVYLTEAAVRALRGHGFQPYWHERIPPNDGGLALGQALCASEIERRTSSCV